MGVTHRPGGLQESVLATIRNVLGESTAGLVQQYVGSNRFENAEEVHFKLTVLFGDSARTLEKTIIKELRGRLGLPYEEKNPFDFKGEYGCIVKSYGEGGRVV